MRSDTIFQIRSMTKSVDAVAITVLLEEGRLLLSDPVEKHLPEFRGQMMVDRREGDKVVSLKKASRPITIRDLLTHTSGMAGQPWREPFKRWYYEEFRKRRDWTLAELMAIFAQQPLEFEPGAEFLYSDPGFATLRRIIEVVSGQPYEKFLERRIFQPLGMKDSSAVLAPPEKHHRIASIYNLENGTLKKSQQDPYHPGGFARWGLYSTAMDTFAFYQMMLNGGTYKGTRILSRASGEVMTRLQTGDLEYRSGGPAVPGMGYGLGWQIIREPSAPFALALGSIGSYGHGGFLGTWAWADPKKDLVGVFLIQRHQGSRPGHGPERMTFMALAAAAIVD